MDYPKSKSAELRLVGDKFADRAGAVPGSVVPAGDWANPVTDELIATIQAAGLVEDEATLTQLRDAVKILARGGALGFRAKPQNPETLSLDIEAGAFFSRDTGLMVAAGSQIAGPIAAPAANPRNDIVYIDALDSTVGIATGAEDAVPVDPALPDGKLPVTRVNAYVGMTEIVAADLDELRYLDTIGLSLTSGVQQIVQTQDSAVATGTTSFPNDDTIPQNTEGDEYMTRSITPKSAASRLRIDVVVCLSHSSSLLKQAALFRDAGAAALAAAGHWNGSSTGLVTLKFSYDMASPGIALTTFKVRAGSDGAGTTTFNGSGGSRKYGGVIASSIIVTEYMP